MTSHDSGLLARRLGARIRTRLKDTQVVEGSDYLGTAYKDHADFIRRRVVERNFLGRVLGTRYQYLAIIRQGSNVRYVELDMSEKFQQPLAQPSREQLTRAIEIALAKSLSMEKK